MLRQLDGLACSLMAASMHRYRAFECTLQMQRRACQFPGAFLRPYFLAVLRSAPAGARISPVILALAAGIKSAAAFVVLPHTSLFLFGDEDELLPFGGQATGKCTRYVMRCPTTTWGEMVAGVGASGIQGIVAWSGGVRGLTCHPFVPTVLVGYEGAPDVDVALVRDDPATWCAAVAQGVRDIYSGRRARVALADFQLARGPTGVSV